ncbi:MAG: hypothetical protein ABIT05_09365 [Chitinophagaceae bacterium]
MKKIFLLVTTMFMLTCSFATASTSHLPLNAAEIFFPVGKNKVKISLLELSAISIKDLQVLTEMDLGFFEKIKFKIAQKKLRMAIDRDGTINNREIEKMLQRKGGETGFHAGGFALGFFFLILGVLFAYLINDDYKRNRVKWAWFGTSVMLGILLVLAAVASQGVY